MKSRLALSILCVFSAQAFAADAALTTQQQKFSYALGYQLGKSFKDKGIDVDPAVLGDARREAQPRLLPILHVLHCSRAQALSAPVPGAVGVPAAGNSGQQRIEGCRSLHQQIR